MNASSTVSRAALVGIVLVFVVPLLLAVLLYSQHESWSLGDASHGELIEPVRPLGSVEFLALDDQRLNTDDLRGHWTLIHIGGGDCADDCADSLYKTRQVRLALGHERSRVQRLYLAPDRQGMTALQDLLDVHPRLTVAAPRARAPEAFSDAAEGQVYLIDPQLNVMMRYEPDAEPRGMLEDLEHLLEVSRIG